jgi:hypothetical protein
MHLADVRRTEGSTVVITISIILLGGFIVLVDQVFFRVFMFFKL